MRLIDHILSLGLSRADAKRALQNGKVFVRGVPSALAVREVDPQDVELRANARRCKPGADLVVMHRASGYVVVWKPSGLLSVPAPGRRDEASVLTQVEGLFGSGLAVHRLDEDTSGLMLVALKEDAQLHLKDELAQRNITRAYLAIVAPPVKQGWKKSIENILVRDAGDGRRGSGTGAEGRRAVTHFTERQRIGTVASLVEARLETGRTHQIRIHLAELSHPVIGDTLYGTRQRAALRLALHAYSLAFKDPVGESMSFEVPLPDDMTSFIHRDGLSPHAERGAGSGGRRGTKRRK